MDKFPKKISKDPIQEAVFEVRFSSVFPSEAVFGIIYQVISKHLIDAQLIQLPILQLPEVVRQSDPNLMYQPHHRLQKENLSISVGPRVITFSNLKPYIGWDKWKLSILNVLHDLVNANVFISLERSGLRYINVIYNQLLRSTNIEIIIIDKALTTESTMLRTEIKEGSYTTVLQLSNNVNISTGGTNFIGSAIDIDVLNDFSMDNRTFGENIGEILDQSHNKGKKLFFSLLTKDYLDRLNPEY